MNAKDMAWMVRWATLLKRMRECAEGKPSGSITFTQQDCEDLVRGMRILSPRSKDDDPAAD